MKMKVSPFLGRYIRHLTWLLAGGETGVFDVEELVDLLREDNAQDVVVIQVRTGMNRTLE